MTAHARAWRQRILVVDPNARTREHARRAVRALGHAPLVFENVEELFGAERTVSRCALMIFGISTEMLELRTTVALARERLGRHVPILFVVNATNLRPLGELGELLRDELLIAPGTFSDVYAAVRDFLVRTGLPVADDGLSWGRYVFDPAQRTARVADMPIQLDVSEFELALEFFHNVNRALSTDWLRAMVQRTPVRGWPRWLDSRVDILCQRLELGQAAMAPAVPLRYSGYRLNAVEEGHPAGFFIERCLGED